MLINGAFPFDSVITAGGKAWYREIMIAAVVIAMIVLYLFSPAIGGFHTQTPHF